MPTFYQDTDLDIEVEDFLDECSPSEIQEVIDYLEYNDLMPIPNCRNKMSSNNIYGISASESIYESEINKLHNNWNRLTKEEEELILSITKKF